MSSPYRVVEAGHAEAPDTRLVRMTLEDIGSMSLLELAEVSELAGAELADILKELHAGHLATMARAVVALAVVLERRHDPGVDMQSARRWRVEVVGSGTAGPRGAGRARRRGPEPAG